MDSLHREKALLRSLREGSEEAFSILYDLYFNSIFHYCASVSKSDIQAADITQEVFTKVWQYRKTINPDLPFKSYIFRIAKNYLIDAYRQSVNSYNYAQYLKIANPTFEEESNTLEYEELSLKLNSIISKLPTAQRRVFLLKKMNNLTNSEIAELLSIKEQTVKNQLVSAVKFIRRHLLNFSSFPISIILYIALNK